MTPARRDAERRAVVLQDGQALYISSTLQRKCCVEAEQRHTLSRTSHFAPAASNVRATSACQFEAAK
jgi:hypothetical protein